MKTQDHYQEFVELYVNSEVENEIDKQLISVIGINHRIYKNQLLFIISKVIWKQVHHPNDYKDNGARLRIHANSKMLQENPDIKKGTLVWYIGKSSKVKNQIESLKEWGIIKQFKAFKPNVTARTYKLTDRFNNDPVIRRRFTCRDGAFVKRLLKEKKERLEGPLERAVLNIYDKHVSISEEGLLYLESRYSHFPVVKDTADAHRNGLFDDNKEELLTNLRQVSVNPIDERLWMIFTKNYYASIGKRNGRLDHNLTNLERGFRRFILLNGRSMHSTDIVNSQPTFSIPVIQNKLKEMQGQSCMIPDDMIRYANSCVNGIFYETIAEKAEIDIDSPERREHFKRNHLYPEVLYCRNNNWNTRTQLAFRSLFPSADMAIRELKKQSHNNFSIELQRLESDLMINTVFTQLINNGFIILPLHDAIYCSSEATKMYAEGLIAHAFKEKHGLDVSFKSGNETTELLAAA